MSKTRTAAKWLVGTLAATALVLGSTTAPAQARDTGWGFKAKDNVSAVDTGWGFNARDTGWGFNARDTGWG